MRLFFLILGLLCADAARAAGVWESLHGRWSGGGQVSGMAASVELEFRPALEGRAHHLAFHNRMRMPDASVWPFRAEAFYLCDAEGICRGHWYDSRGTILPVVATSADDRLVVEWGGEGTERGRTTYRLTEDGLEIVDEVQGPDGSMRPFGRTELARDPD